MVSIILPPPWLLHQLGNFHWLSLKDLVRDLLRTASRRLWPGSKPASLLTTHTGFAPKNVEHCLQKCAEQHNYQTFIGPVAPVYRFHNACRHYGTHNVTDSLMFPKSNEWWRKQLPISYIWSALTQSKHCRIYYLWFVAQVFLTSQVNPNLCENHYHSKESLVTFLQDVSGCQAAGSCIHSLGASWDGKPAQKTVKSQTVPTDMILCTTAEPHRRIQPTSAVSIWFFLSVRQLATVARLVMES